MGIPGIFNWRRWLAVIAVAASLALVSAAFALPASAASPNITGIVEDTSGTPQGNVAVNVLNPATDATVASTMTAPVDGTFSVSVSAGTYNVQFIAPSGTNLQSYLATGVSTDSAPLTVILKSVVSVQVQGTLSDAQGNVYGTSQDASVTFTSPLNALAAAGLPTGRAGTRSRCWPTRTSRPACSRSQTAGS